MKWAEANRLRLCLCCGRRNATLLKLSDGRLYRACGRCMRACATCGPMLNGATIREPVGSE